MVDKEEIYHSIDALSPKSLEELREYVAYLRFKEERKDPDWFGKLHDVFAPVRAGIEASGMTDDEVNEVLDEALQEVRRERKA